jgi:peptidyl-prolyl cis-trans isomerase SurA
MNTLLRYWKEWTVIAVLLLAGANGRAETIDGILAIVNDDVITDSEFQDRYRNILRDLAARNADLPPADILRRQVLERMITEKIQLQVAQRLGIRVGEDTVDDAVRSLARNNRMDLPQFRAALERDGVDMANLRNNIRNQITIRRLVEREVASRVTISDEEIETFLAGPTTRTAAREYDISHVLVRIPELASTDALNSARARADQAYSRISEGMAFEQAAVRYSQADDALEGGRLGWRKPGQLPTLFLDALNELEPGQVSEVLRSPNGFHILRLNELRGGGAKSITQTHARHILIKTDEFITPAEATRRLSEIRERIINGEDFGALARVHSDDTVSGIRGGDLDWVSPGEVVRPFEQAMDRLQPGEISEPVRSPFGVHIIQVLERREQTVAEDIDRSNARDQLRARKTDERYEQWLRRLRDESYVEVLPADRTAGRPS